VVVLAAAWNAGCEREAEPTCCEEIASCPEGSREVEACETGACFTAAVCCSFKRCEPDAGCVVACPPGESQVASCEDSTGTDCHTVQQCDVPIQCEKPALCTALPECDEGDEARADELCAEGEALCYEVERCGVVIACTDNGVIHGCLDAAPAEGDVCDLPVTCEYSVKGSDCVEVWQCQEPIELPAPIPDEVLSHWHLVSGCEGGAGSGGSGGSE
jgi:hypothetical protein